MSDLVKVFAPSGIFDKPQAEPFRQEVIRYAESGTSIILVDLENVIFMDSSGLGVLLLALKKVQEHGGRLCLCSIQEQVRILFELTKMEQLFEIYPHRAAFAEQLATESV